MHKRLLPACEPSSLSASALSTQRHTTLKAASHSHSLDLPGLPVSWPAGQIIQWPLAAQGRESPLSLSLPHQCLTQLVSMVMSNDTETQSAPQRDLSTQKDGTV